MGFLPLAILLLGSGTDTPPAPGSSGATPTVSSNDAPAPITGKGRLEWVLKGTIGPASLGVGVLEAGWGNLFDRPKEYGEGMEGFGKRFGLRLSSVGTSNVMEAGLGALWHEDPRYFRSRSASRFGHAFKMTFMAERSDGSLDPAYARYIAYFGSNAISDSWRPDSQRTVANTMERVGYRFTGRLMSNLWKEYWPDMKSHVFGSKH
jgi:hypothetical protein